MSHWSKQVAWPSPDSWRNKRLLMQGIGTLHCKGACLQEMREVITAFFLNQQFKKINDLFILIVSSINSFFYINQPISVYCCSVTQLCLTLGSRVDCSTAGFPVLLPLPEFAQTCVHWVSDAIQTSHALLPLLLPSIFPSIRDFSSESAVRIRWPT